MFTRHSSNRKSLALLKATVICSAIALSWPAQTGQNARGSSASEFTSFTELKSAQYAVRRVNADFCRTDGEIVAQLLGEGFQQVFLGANSGVNAIDAYARFGPGKYKLAVDRCTGRLQSVKRLGVTMD